MTSPSTKPLGPGTFFSRHWKILTQVAVWILGIVGTFLTSPPVVALSGDQPMPRFFQFVVTVLAGLLLVPTARWNQQTWALAFAWGAVALVALVAAVIAFLGYDQLKASWTTAYTDKIALVTGPKSALTQHAAEYIREHPDITIEELVKDYAGEVERIWQRDVLLDRRRWLLAFYISLAPLFTVCLIATVQAVHCALPDPTTAGPTPPNPT